MRREGDGVGPTDDEGQQRLLASGRLSPLLHEYRKRTEAPAEAEAVGWARVAGVVERGGLFDSAGARDGADAVGAAEAGAASVAAQACPPDGPLRAVARGSAVSRPVRPALPLLGGMAAALAALWLVAAGPGPLRASRSDVEAAAAGPALGPGSSGAGGSEGTSGRAGGAGGARGARGAGGA